jgi:hypothetical protein
LAGQRQRLFVISYGDILSEIIEDFLLIATLSQPGEWENQVIYLPLK